MRLVKVLSSGVQAEVSRAHIPSGTQTKLKDAVPSALAAGYHPDLSLFVCQAQPQSLLMSPELMQAYCRQLPATCSQAAWTNS